MDKGLLDFVGELAKEDAAREQRELGAFNYTAADIAEGPVTADEQALVMPNGTLVSVADVLALAGAALKMSEQISCLWDENGTFDPYAADGFDGMEAQGAANKIDGLTHPMLAKFPPMTEATK